MAKDITKYADRRNVNTNVSANTNNADKEDMKHFRDVAEKVDAQKKERQVS